MKIVFSSLLFLSIGSNAQMTNEVAMKDKLPINFTIQEAVSSNPDATSKIIIDKSKRWKLDRNKLMTGGLIFTAGLAKGFNEAIQYKYNGFEDIFPKANDQWFYPTFSYNNKYKDNNPANGPKFPLSTSVLVMFTDQYHLNNFIQRAALTGALVIKIGEGKRPLKHYLMDLAYYTVCYQIGFHSVYAPISARN